jgi:hypothetical protein
VLDVSLETGKSAVGPAHGRIVGFARCAAQTTFSALSIDIFCNQTADGRRAGVSGFD